MQSRNARKIADEGGKLYDKFMGFAETLLDLGKSISASSEKYEKAIKQLKTGQGNLIRRTERLRELGVKATKASRTSCPTTTRRTSGRKQRP